MDHESLKYLLEQKTTTLMQQKRMFKLIGFDYTIVYRKGKENLVVDALSRRDSEEEDNLAISAVTPAWVSELLESYRGDRDYERLIAHLAFQPGGSGPYTINQGVLQYKGRICVGETRELRDKLIKQFHDFALGGHSGIQHTYQ